MAAASLFSPPFRRAERERERERERESPSSLGPVLQEEGSCYLDPLSPQPIDMTVRDALNSTLDEEMSVDPKVFLMGEEVGEYQDAYKISNCLLDKYGPERVLDTPITEAGFTRIAIGAAYHGLRPVEFMTFNFSLQLQNSKWGIDITVN